MRRILLLMGICCLSTACAYNSYTPPPPPMPFVVAWAPEAVPAVQVHNVDMLLQTLDNCNSGALVGKNSKDNDFLGVKFISKPAEGKNTLLAGKLYFIRPFNNGTENTTAVMLNLTVDKQSKVLECLAEKVIYRSK